MMYRSLMTLTLIWTKYSKFSSLFLSLKWSIADEVTISKEVKFIFVLSYFCTFSRYVLFKEPHQLWLLNSHVFTWNNMTLKAIKFTGGINVLQRKPKLFRTRISAKTYG